LTDGAINITPILISKTKSKSIKARIKLRNEYCQKHALLDSNKCFPSMIGIIKATLTWKICGKC